MFTYRAGERVRSVWKSHESARRRAGEVVTNSMVACADLMKKHEKKMRQFLDEFYRVHSELANRAFDFIQGHDLRSQFGKKRTAKKEPIMRMLVRRNSPP